MKRINKPEEMPDAYKMDILERNEDLNEVFELKKNDDYDDIPNKQVFNHFLRKIKSFRNIRKPHKIQNLKCIFIHELQIILSSYDPQDINNVLNDSLLVEVMNTAEKYFFYGSKKERDSNKNECVIQLMLKYFRNDRQLLQKTMDLVKNRIIKSTRIQRLMAKVKYFFLSHKMSL